MPPGGSFHWLQRPDDIRIRYALWPEPDTGSAKGTMIIVPGRTEFVEKYFETIGELQQRGFAVAILDLRGQGLSNRTLDNPLKGHITHFQDYIDDLHELIDKVVLPLMPRPLSLLGHSMGGNISLLYLHDHNRLIRRAVLSAPMTGIKLPLVPPVVGAWLTRFAAAVGGGDKALMGTRWGRVNVTFDENLATRDHERFERFSSLLRAEPFLALGPPTFGWGKAAYQAMASLESISYLEKITTPILIVSAGHDRLIESATHRTLAQLLPSAQLEEIADCEHEILMERDELRRAFWNAFDGFVERDKT